MASTIDFRFLDDGFGCPRKKRGRSDEDLKHGMDIDTNAEIEASLPSFKRLAVASAENPNKPAYGRPTYDGVIAGQVSGKQWKKPRKRASARLVSRKGSTFEERILQRELKKSYKERMNELKEEIKQNKIEKRKRREDAEKRKKENVLKSGTKLQKISNPNTLKRIAKSKQRKMLKVVPDDWLNK